MIATLLVSWVGSRAHASLTPIGDEFEVTTYTTSSAYAPRVAADADGGFVVVWQAYSMGSAADVFGRRFDAAGTPVTGEFEINTYTTGFQESPSVALANDDEFLVAWSGAGQDDPNGSFARIFDADAGAKGAEFALHAPTEAGFERLPAVAADGSFLVGWVGDGAIAGVHVDAAANVTPAFDIEVQDCKRIGLDTLPGGDFVIVWSNHSYAGTIASGGYVGVVHGREFAADGTAGATFEVDASRDDPTGYGFVVDGNASLSIAADARGDFAVGHDSYVPNYYYNVDEQVSGYGLGLKLENFVGASSQGSSFVPQQSNGPAFQVGPDVAKTPGGNTVVVWSDAVESPQVIDTSAPDVDGDAVFARVLDCNGNDDTNGAVQINAYTSGSQNRPAVAATEAGSVIVVWQREQPDGQGYGIVGRRFALTDVCVLCGDADASGRVTASDALTALRTSVGSSTCVAGRCDADGSQTITAADALRILRAAVAGGRIDLSCAPAD